ncbi:ABC transporter ATP-binding protein [Pikeienuella sp. HZG-20]|uniref:ABC transporter ATP-binding protein n=1 Tax=Paludibacillus litoralis TaxID=3133267 RepID=UPI0030EF545D
MLSVTGLTMRYQPGPPALDQVSFDMEPGEFFTVVGPSNAGKSTLLKTIAGLERPEAGRIAIAGRDMTRAEPRHRGVSLLFQNIALFPASTGFENIAFPLRTAGWGEPEIEARVVEIASLLRVSHVLERLPRTFSGGEQQRVAIGRALAAPSDLLMLDEPLTNLDARIRVSLRIAFKTLHRETGQSILYVTHDQTEAMSLSDRIGVLNNGVFEQVGSPDELYQTPRTAFVAGFLGAPPMNLLPAEFTERDGVLIAHGDGFQAPLVGRAEGPRPTEGAIGVRPEAISVSPHQSAETPLAAEALQIERLGGHHVIDIRLGGQVIRARSRPDHPVTTSGPVWIGFRPAAEHILDRRSGLFARRSG